MNKVHIFKQTVSHCARTVQHLTGKVVMDVMVVRLQENLPSSLCKAHCKFGKRGGLHDVLEFDFRVDALGHGNTREIPKLQEKNISLTTPLKIRLRAKNIWRGFGISTRDRTNINIKYLRQETGTRDTRKLLTPRKTTSIAPSNSER